MRKAGDEKWVDETLEEWPENDFRIFCGNMGNEVNDEVLANAFKKYGSFAKARIIRDKKNLKSKWLLLYLFSKLLLKLNKKSNKNILFIFCYLKKN